jgi:hypothetical protein
MSGSGHKGVGSEDTQSRFRPLCASLNLPDLFRPFLLPRAVGWLVASGAVIESNDQ